MKKLIFYSIFLLSISTSSAQHPDGPPKPEIVNNVELGYTFMYMYNFKIGYSKTNNNITQVYIN